MKDQRIRQQKVLGSDRYFIKNDKVVKIDDAFDVFIDLIVIRDATEEEIKLYEEYWKARDVYLEMKYR